MKDDFVGSLGLVVGLRMSNSDELRLAPQGAKVVYDHDGVELAPVVKKHCTRDAKAGDDILPDKLSNFGCRDRGNSLVFYPLGKVIPRNKKVLVLTRGFGKRSKYVHAPRSKW